MSSREEHVGSGEGYNEAGERIKFEIYKRGRSWRLTSIAGNELAHPSCRSVVDAVKEARIVYGLSDARLISMAEGAARRHPFR